MFILAQISRESRVWVVYQFEKSGGKMTERGSRAYFLDRYNRLAVELDICPIK
jgi:hypothetical protein